MIALGSAAFLLFGVVLVVLGACHSGLTQSLDLGHTSFGWLGSALSAGIATGVVGAGPLVDRYPRRPIFLGSTLLVAAALGSVDDDMSYTRALVHVAVMGAGAGVFDTLLNAVTVERWGERSVRPMAWLHAMVPVGAMATPWLVHQAGGAAEWIGFFRSTGLAFAVLSLWVALVPMPAPGARSGRDAGAPSARFARPAFAALCVVALAYIGIEAALTLFAVPYASALGLPETTGQRAISAVWLGILGGRLLLMLPDRGLDARALVVSGVLGAAVLAIATGLGLHQIEIVMGVCGLVLSGVFPLMIALAGRLVPESPGQAVGLVAGIGSLGGFALPPLVGAIADASDIAIAVGSLAAWCGLIAVAGAVAWRDARASA